MENSNGYSLIITSHDPDITQLFSDGSLIKLQDHKGRVLSSAYLHESKLLLTGGQFKTIKVWDLNK